MGLSEYNSGVIFSYPGSAVTASRAWLGGAEVTLAAPDFSAVTGFRRPQPLPANSALLWTITARGQNSAAATGECTDGARSVETTLRGRM